MADVQVENGPGWVVMYHPDCADANGDPVYTEVPQEAFDAMWEAKGWVLASNRSLTDDEIASATKTQLVAEAEARGVDTSGTADVLRARLLSGEEA